MDERFTEGKGEGKPGQVPGAEHCCEPWQRRPATEGPEVAGLVLRAQGLMEQGFSDE